MAMTRPDRCSAGDSLHLIGGRAECCALLRNQEKKKDWIVNFLHLISKDKGSLDKQIFTEYYT